MTHTSNSNAADIKLFTGNANTNLACQTAERLELPLGKATVDRFSDDEINVEILENVRGHEVFIMQSTCAPAENLMELIIMADALRRASAASITAVLPYFGYARQDRRPRSARVPISAKVVADMIATVGISRLITLDLHADQIQGFFYMPVDNVYATPAMLQDIRECGYKAPVIVSPDVGGVVRARAIAKRLEGSELAIIDKRRPKNNQAEVMNIIGDIHNRNCIIVDDIIDTAGTLSHAATALKEQGAKSVSAYCTHPILSGSAIDKITHSALDELVVTDSMPLHDQARQCSKIRVLGMADTLAETILRVNRRESVSSMFSDHPVAQ
jgi:ribose-phosphate pyrophosphokinase